VALDDRSPCNLGLTEEEARRYYDEHKSDFTTPAAITLRELVVNVPTDGKNVNVASDEETRKKADAVLARLKAGEAFEKLVTEVSDSPLESGMARAPRRSSRDPGRKRR